MIYIPECRLCGREELTLDCLKDLSICGTCWIAPPSPGCNRDYRVDGEGRAHAKRVSAAVAEPSPAMARPEDRTLVNIQNLRKNNICFGVGSSGVE